MSWKHVQDNWETRKQEIKQRWGDLPEKDIDGIDGTRDRLEHLIEKYYRKAREEVRQEVDEWAATRD